MHYQKRIGFYPLALTLKSDLTKQLQNGHSSPIGDFLDETERKRAIFSL
jgi:hypothetical protein